MTGKIGRWEVGLYLLQNSYRETVRSKGGREACSSEHSRRGTCKGPGKSPLPAIFYLHFCSLHFDPPAACDCIQSHL